MANLGFTVNQNELPEDNNDFSPLPAGEYNVRIADASLETTKAGTGQYIKMRLDVIGPTHEGRVVFGNLNIRNPNPKAEEIGQQQLGSVMRAIGVQSLSDTDQLIGGCMCVKLAIRRSEEYGDSNDVKSYKAMQGGSAPMPRAMPKQAPAGGMDFEDDIPPFGQPAPQPAASSAPPWARK